MQRDKKAKKIFNTEVSALSFSGRGEGKNKAMIQKVMAHNIPCIHPLEITNN